jgi:hypothetical protein
MRELTRITILLRSTFNKLLEIQIFHPQNRFFSCLLLLLSAHILKFFFILFLRMRIFAEVFKILIRLAIDDDHYNCSNLFVYFTVEKVIFVK